MTSRRTSPKRNKKPILIKRIDAKKCDPLKYKTQWACALILTHNNKIMLQQRSPGRRNFPEYLSTFGGRIEPGEQPIKAMVRELKEELSADVKESELIEVGPITEAVTGHTEVVHTYFWHDKRHKIGQCNEDTPVEIDTFDQVKTHPKIMDFVPWMMRVCRSKIKKEREESEKKDLDVWDKGFEVTTDAFAERPESFEKDRKSNEKDIRKNNKGNIKRL